MIETMNSMNTRALATIHAGNAEDAGGQFYRAYYLELVLRGANRVERNRRLEEIKVERRRVRREKWLKGIKSLAGGLISSETVG